MNINKTLANVFKSSQFTALYQQTMPMLVGLLAIMSSQLIDGIFIGQLGAKSLAVVGFTNPIYQLVIGIQVGIGIATTACISNALGANKYLFAKHLAALVLIIGIVTITLLCGLLWHFQQAISTYLGAEQSLFQLLRSYWFPWLISCWLGAILYFGYGICRSHGETLISGRVMVLTSIINVILDPLFIFSFNMGMAGAAWATCFSFIIGCLIVFRTILRRRLIALPFALKRLQQGVITIVKFAIPATLGQFIPPVSAMLVTMVIASYGDIAIGAWGLINRLESIVIILILALTMALPPMVGKLKGKKQYQEIYHLIKIAVTLIIGFQLLVALVLLVSANPIARLMTSSDEITVLLQQYLWIVPISYGALGVCMVCISACNAMGVPRPALMMSLLRLFGCFLPMVWLGSELYGLLGVFIGATIGNFLSGMVGWSIFLQQYDQLREQHLKAHYLISQASGTV